jgi:hypothetical protein
MSPVLLIFTLIPLCVIIRWMSTFHVHTTHILSKGLLIWWVTLALASLTAIMTASISYLGMLFWFSTLLKFQELASTYFCAGYLTNPRTLITYIIILVLLNGLASACSVDLSRLVRISRWWTRKVCLLLVTTTTKNPALRYRLICKWINLLCHIILHLRRLTLVIWGYTTICLSLAHLLKKWNSLLDRLGHDKCFCDTAFDLLLVC